MAAPLLIRPGLLPAVIQGDQRRRERRLALVLPNPGTPPFGVDAKRKGFQLSFCADDKAAVVGDPSFHDCAPRTSSAKRRSFCSASWARVCIASTDSFRRRRSLASAASSTQR